MSVNWSPSTNIKALNCLQKTQHQVDFLDAAHKGYLKTLKRLHTADISLEIRDGLGETALIKATLGRHLDIVEYLLQEGAKVDGEDRFQQTPLMIAAGLGELEIVKRLLLHKANVHARKNDGMTPLICTAWFKRLNAITAAHAYGNPLCIEEFLGNATEESFSIPEITAVEIGKLLLDAGSNIEDRDNNGYTALEYAVWAEDGPLYALLKEKAEASHQNEKG